jgi:glycine/D-amino acid oxidase-like deaminating enzyme
VPDRDGLLIAAGHGRNGILLAPITAQLIVDTLLGKAGPELDQGLSPASRR